MKRLSMWRWLILLGLSTTLIQAATNKEIEAFITKSVNQTQGVELEKFDITKREALEGLSGWDRVEFTIDVKMGERKESQKQGFFVHKGLIAPQLIRLESSEKKIKTVTDDQLIAIAQQSVAQNPAVALKDARVIRRMPLVGVAGWESLQLEFDLDVRQGESARSLTTTELWFVGKDTVAPELIRLPDGQSLKHTIKGEVTDEHLRLDRLIAGNADAKYRLVVFSDPLCPACKKSVPDLIALAQKHPKKVAIYYYHKPVSALSPVLMKASLALKAQGSKAAELGLYEKTFQIDSPDELTALKAFNKAFEAELTLLDINTPQILAHMNVDAKAAGELLILGTPTVFVNGVFDEDHSRVEAIKKELR